ncbi:VanZ family protein [Mucilaginibacter auburnensis]|uniref:VanZ family protein n=1 Tax=Mucilaginibacter auburnensis TaxID=1457233 RepID=A0A2H9VQD3_9SPHI|nr:VanZ family protein [Mucilaginibacter auburnensis]PJJ83046.1 VanZ family protein [Mucilaginibacter auburnensis]
MAAWLKYQRLTLWWALFVFIMCNANLGHIGSSPRFFPGFDKLVHCGFFFVFVVLCVNGFIRQQRLNRLMYKHALFILLIAIVFGGLIELLQLTIFTWRSCEWADLFADTVGAGMGIFSILVTTYAVDDVKK